jgi:hypothetical protein
MISKMYLSVVLFIAAVIWGLLLVLNGVTVQIKWLQHLSTVVGILVLLLTSFDLWLWRLPLLRGWFVKRPNISGTWRATIRSNWVDPSTGKTIESLKGFMVVRQTFSSLSLRLITEESASQLLGAQIVRAQDGVFLVTGVYRNEPKFSVRHRSPIHHGAILLDIIGAPPDSLKGHYWTDRGTAGELELSGRRKRVFDDFDSAELKIVV